MSEVLNAYKKYLATLKTLPPDSDCKDFCTTLPEEIARVEKHIKSLETKQPAPVEKCPECGLPCDDPRCCYYDQDLNK